MKVNYKSDFKVVVAIKGKNFFGIPFRFTFFTVKGGNEVVVSYDGTTYTDCKKLDDNNILVAFDNHNLRPGLLRVVKEYFINDSDYKDGVCNLRDVETLNIELVEGKSDVVDEFTATINQTFLKPLNGIDYFTDEEKENFKNAVLAEIVSNEDFKNTVVSALAVDEDLLNALKVEVSAAVINDVADLVSETLKNDEDFIEAVKPNTEPEEE